MNNDGEENNANDADEKNKTNDAELDSVAPLFSTQRPCFYNTFGEALPPHGLAPIEAQPRTRILLGTRWRSRTRAFKMNLDTCQVLISPASHQLYIKQSIFNVNKSSTSYCTAYCSASGLLTAVCRVVAVKASHHK